MKCYIIKSQIIIQIKVVWEMTLQENVGVLATIQQIPMF